MSTNQNWHRADEDREVEPGNRHGQAWDLEGFFIDNASLTMIGGFDFVNGQGNITSGDLFIDIDGDAQYGPANRRSGSGYTTVQNSFGYDYVFDLDFDSMSYTVFSLNQATTTTVYYRQNDESNPWRYESGGEEILDGTIGYITGLTDQETGFTGGYHNAVTVDLSFLGDNVDFIAHFTMGCGNDNLMGQGTTSAVPEPATFALVGIGLLFLGRLGRKAA